jgi:hypothetical protein
LVSTLHAYSNKPLMWNFSVGRFSLAPLISGSSKSNAFFNLTAVLFYKTPFFSVQFPRSDGDHEPSVWYCSLFTHSASYFLLQRSGNHGRCVYQCARHPHNIIYVYKATCEQRARSSQSLSRVSRPAAAQRLDGRTGYLCAIFVWCAREREREHPMAFSTSRLLKNKSLSRHVLCEWEFN